MAGKIRVQVKFEGEIARVKALVVHPMETGSRKDPDTDAIVPRRHIQRLTFANNGIPVLLADCSTAVSRNPYFDFRFRGAGPGDTFTVNWVDTSGETGSHEMTLA